MTPTSPRAAVPAQPDAISPVHELEAIIAEFDHGLPFDKTSRNTIERVVAALTAAQPTHEQIAAYLQATGTYVTNDATREAAIADAIAADRASQGAAERAVPAPASALGAIMGAAYDFRDAHMSGSTKEKRAAHAALESAVIDALRASHGQAPAGAATSESLSQRPSEENTLVWIADPISSTGVRGVFVDDIKCVWWWKAGLIFRKESDAAALAVRMRAVASHGEAPAGAAPRKIDECYGDCPTDPNTCANPCKFLGRESLPAPTAQAAPAAGAVATPAQKPEDFEVTIYPPMPTSGFLIGVPKGVKVTHKPTGLFATSEDERGQHRNRDVAWNKLQALLAAAPTPAAQADSAPPEYVGNGMFKGETIAKAAEHWANWCDHRCMTGLSEFLRVVAAQADSGVQEDAARKARLAGMHKFLEWNRGQGTARPVPGPCEYSVFNQAVDIYCAALAAKGQKNG